MIPRYATKVVNQNTENNQVAAERLQPEVNQDIESIQTTGSSSSEDVDTIETTNPSGTPIAERPYKKTTAINAADTKREVTITIGGEQMIQPIGAQAESSVIHVRMWNRYILWLRKNGKKHGGYERFREISRDKKGA